MNAPRLLDLFCGAGGAGMGYHRASFEVTGVDIANQKRYPFTFVQADAFAYLAMHWQEYDIIHASPPCQFATRTNARYRSNHLNLIAPIRAALQQTGKPYIIENVEDARRWLRRPVMLCGSMFGLPIERHRLFETNPEIIARWGDKLFCRHIKTPMLVTGVTRRKGEPRRENSVQECREATGIDWMVRAELDEAIPPVFTEYIGRRMLEYIS